MPLKEPVGCSVGVVIVAVTCVANRVCCHHYTFEHVFCVIFYFSVSLIYNFTIMSKYLPKIYPTSPSFVSILIQGAFSLFIIVNSESQSKICTCSPLSKKRIVSQCKLFSFLNLTLSSFTFPII